MGFKVPKNTLTVTFPGDPIFEGAEIEMRLTINDTLKLQEFVEEDGSVTIGNMDKLERMIDVLSGLVISWNLTDDDDNPIPVSKESFREHIDITFMTKMFLGFAKGAQQLTDIPEDFKETSSDGNI